MKTLIISIALFFIPVLMYSQDTTGMGAFAKKIINLIIDFKYDNAVEMMDTSIIKASGKETISKTMSYRQMMFGSINTFQPYQSSVITKDGVSYYSIRYKSECVKGTGYDRVDVIKRNEGFKIYNYRYSNSDKGIDKN